VTPLLQQLYGLRLMIDGLIATVEHELGAQMGAAPQVEGEEPECAHPREMQVSASVMGGPAKVMCLVCGQERLGTVE